MCDTMRYRWDRPELSVYAGLLGCVALFVWLVV